MESGLERLSAVKGRPLGEEGAGETSVKVVAGQVQGLWKIVLEQGFEQGFELIIDLGAAVHKRASAFDECSQLVGLVVIRNPSSEAGMIEKDKVGEMETVHAVVLGLRGLIGLPPPLERRRIAEEELEKLVLNEEGGVWITGGHG